MTQVFSVLYIEGSGDIFGGGQMSLLEVKFRYQTFVACASCKNCDGYMDEVEKD